MAGPGGPQVFFEYLNSLPGPLRVGRIEELTASIGLGEFRPPVKLTSFMAAPILHQGAALGQHLRRAATSRAGRILQRRTRRSLVLFASQAAQVIANARTAPGGATGAG